MDNKSQNEKVKRLKSDVDSKQNPEADEQVQYSKDNATARAKSNDEEAFQSNLQQLSQVKPSAKDEDWLRSRTSRLLDLEDEDENEEVATSTQKFDNEHQRWLEDNIRQSSADVSLLGNVGDASTPEITEANSPAQADQVFDTARLFVRNISYTATESDLRAHFETVTEGFIDEVGYHSLFLMCCPLFDEYPDRDI